MQKESEKLIANRQKRISDGYLPTLVKAMDDPIFKDLYPYGLESVQINFAIMSSGLSDRTLMGMKPRNPGREKRESEVREKARSNNFPRSRSVR